ncbi:MAG: hypothetical protein K2X82_24815 [Gemmataceae bacterium]|nr:hypothetical protein [Gemmataceae bacterium]
MSGLQPLAAILLTLFSPDRLSPPLTVELSTNGRPEVRMASTAWRLPNGQTVLATEVRNFHTDGPIEYGNREQAAGVVRAAGVGDGNVVVPASVVFARTTYRAVDEDTQSYDLTRPGGPALVGGRRWAETGPAPAAKPGRLLVASLRLEDPRDRVACTSAVAARPKGGFTYSYVVRNDTRKPLAVEWGEFSAKLDAGKSKTFEVNSAAVFAERSGTCKVSFEKGPEYTFRTTAWQPAK